MRIEEYALLSDLQTAALVSSEGSIDWLCLPRFDSPASFAALLGNTDNGCWKIAPTGEVTRVDRAYRDGSVVLDTTFTTETGRVRLTDAMPPREQSVEIVRVAECLEGEVQLELIWIARFDYGDVVPWMRRIDDQLIAVAGPEATVFRGDILPEPVDDSPSHRAVFTLKAGERARWTLQWYPSIDNPPAPVEPDDRIAHTEKFWRSWRDEAAYCGPYAEAVHRSLVTLKALTYAPTGGIVAAPTMGLPECIGGERNWDYRYCWLRDASLTLSAFIRSGYTDEAASWAQWLMRSAAGSARNLQILYSIMGERHIVEWEVPWLDGYEGSKPVRAGNAAFGQVQLDVFGEVLDAMYIGRLAGIRGSNEEWPLARALLRYLEEVWQEPDSGIWEVRGPSRHFTHSRVMVWVAFDRGVRLAEEFGLHCDLERWTAIRDEVHAQVCEQGWNDEVGAFTQYYGSTEVDASLLLMPAVGFLPADDKRVMATMELIEKDLKHGIFVDRYHIDGEAGEHPTDGLVGREGAFLACSFWYVDALTLAGRVDEAREMFEALLELRNDVGLLAEEYDEVDDRQLGNFPQAFSHLALINSAHLLDPKTVSDISGRCSGT